VRSRLRVPRRWSGTAAWGPARRAGSPPPRETRLRNRPPRGVGTRRPSSRPPRLDRQQREVGAIRAFAHQHAHLPAVTHQGSGDRRADEPGCARDQRSHAIRTVGSRRESERRQRAGAGNRTSARVAARYRRTSRTAASAMSLGRPQQSLQQPRSYAHRPRRWPPTPPGQRDNNQRVIQTFIVVRGGVSTDAPRPSCSAMVIFRAAMACRAISAARQEQKNPRSPFSTRQPPPETELARKLTYRHNGRTLHESTAARRWDMHVLAITRCRAARRSPCRRLECRFNQT